MTWVAPVGSQGWSEGDTDSPKLGSGEGMHETWLWGEAVGPENAPVLFFYIWENTLTPNVPPQKKAIPLL